MSDKVYFTPGPSQLYPGVKDFIKEGLEDDLGSISHRSKKFQDVFKSTTESLTTLINLPDNYHVFFGGTATEMWDRFLNNCVEDSSYHFVNGSFSQRFYDYAQNSGKKPILDKAEFGSGWNPPYSIPDTEAICVTVNETSSGVWFPMDDVYQIRHSNPDALIALDVVSCIPVVDIDFTKVDSALFSVQKCFGLPAGLGVWLVNDRCIDKALKLQEKGKLIGPHHDIPALLKQAEKNQTPATPNVLGIYTLGRVCEDMLSNGVDTLRNTNQRNADALYQFVNESELFEIAVSEERHRSKTVVVANTNKLPTEINKDLAPHNMAIGSGYGSYKESQIRIANFPAHSSENVDQLIETLKLQESYA